METMTEAVTESPLAKMIHGLIDEMNAVEEAALRLINRLEYVLGPQEAEKDDDAASPSETGFSPSEGELEELRRRMVITRDALFKAQRRIRI